jgi:hypothetical protein
MSLAHAATSAALHVLSFVPADATPGYTPAQLGTDLATNLPLVLAYVGVAVGAGVVIMFTLVGVKGIVKSRS